MFFSKVFLEDVCVSMFVFVHAVNGSVQDQGISSVLAMDMLQSYNEPWKYHNLWYICYENNCSM